MELRPRSHEKVAQLMERGVFVPNPGTVDVGDEVDIDRFSGDGVVIFPGCRIYGAKTAISAGVKLGAEGPVTVDDCALGPQVELRGGYFRESVLLARAGFGWGAQVREACLVEEEAGGAHCVGLKQTILFPFVTLGSLVNFCDCLMSGGSSRADHSEVGSSYVHFNFTPERDKATASLFGDVAGGVMLNRRPIFLGGQGGAVGPVRVSYGTVVAAGSVLRGDVIEENRLVVAQAPKAVERDIPSGSRKNVSRIVKNNVIYVANLVALEKWYEVIRRAFFEHQELGAHLYVAVMEVLARAKAERLRQLEVLAMRVPEGRGTASELRERAAELRDLFFDPVQSDPSAETAFVEASSLAVADKEDYVRWVRGLASDAALAGTRWLQGIVEDLCRKAGGLLESLGPFVATR